MILQIMTKDNSFMKKFRRNINRLKKDIMLNAHLKLKKWEDKKMSKKTEELPNLEGREKPVEESSEDSGQQEEEPKVQMVTSEQLLNVKLDNITLYIQQVDSRLQELLEILTNKK